MIKKIHFFWLNIKGPVGVSTGVSTLSNILENSGYKVRVSHLCEYIGYPFDEDRILKDIENFGADLFAVSFPSTQYNYAEKLIGLISRSDNASPLFCGGIHCMVAPESVISIPGVDGVCLCEADEVFPLLIDEINSGGNWQETHGFWFNTKNGIKKNTFPPPPDISQSKAIDFDRIDYRTLIENKSGFAEVLLGRGCRFRCSFCQNCVMLDRYRQLPMEIRKHRPYLRPRDVDVLVREMKMFIDTSGDVLKGFIFGDDSILYSDKWLDLFLQTYSQEVNYPYIACLVANQVEESLSRRLFDSGCNVIRIGIETGNEGARTGLLRKPVRDGHLFRAAETLHKTGINVQGFGMLGLPGEKQEDVFSLFRLAVEMHLDVFRVSMFVPLPGTPLYDYCEANDLLVVNGEYHDFVTQSSLKLPPGRHLFLEKTRYLLTWMLNAMLPSPIGGWYGKELQKALEMDERSWNSFRADAARKEKELRDKAVEYNLPHYYSPIDGRQDYAFLHLPSRKRKMINIDDGPR